MSGFGSFDGEASRPRPLTLADLREATLAIRRASERRPAPIVLCSTQWEACANVATGDMLDSLASVRGAVRRFDEPDAELRERLLWTRVEAD